MTELELVRQEILAFLSSHPQELKSNGPSHAGKMAVQVGNAILALAYQIEAGQTHKEQPLGERADSLYALGKQFREVGLALWDRHEPDRPVSDSQLKQLWEHFFALESLVKNGGSK